MSSEGQSVLARRLAAENAGAAETAAAAPVVAASPGAASSTPAAPAPEAPPAAAEGDEDGRDRYTYYIDRELGDELDEKADALFWDARGKLSKGDIYTAVIRRGLDDWDAIQRDLWSKAT